MLGHHRSASKMPFQWRFADVPMMASFLVVPLIKHKKNFKVGLPLTKLSGSAHESEQ